MGTPQILVKKSSFLPWFMLRLLHVKERDGGHEHRSTKQLFDRIEITFRNKTLVLFRSAMKQVKSALDFLLQGKHKLECTENISICFSNSITG